jgi:cytochrome c5
MKFTAKTSLIGFTSLTAFITIVSCTQTFQDPNEFHAKPSADMAYITNVELSELNKGHEIYLEQCSKCHEAKLPGAIASKHWQEVIPKMSDNAGLSKADEKTLRTYIISACRFIEREYEH